MRLALVIISISISALVTSLSSAVHAAEDPAMTTPVLATTMTDIDGKPYAFAADRGKVIMLVNVASRCGNTPQYTALEAMFEKYRDQGFVIVGIPANNFGGQEPGSDPEIKTFCTTKYQVTFPILSKVSVKGDDICPLYQYLTTQSPFPGPIGWNFAKFLVGRDGQVVARFDPKTKPDNADLVAAVEKAIAAPAPK